MSVEKQMIEIYHKITNLIEKEWSSLSKEDQFAFVDFNNYLRRRLNQGDQVKNNR
jgi:hypothetical protein